MVSVGSAEVTVKLSLQQLLKDAAKTQKLLKEQLKDVPVNVKVQADSRAIVGLAQTLQTSFGAAKQFAESLNLTASQADAAVNRLRELDSVGATIAEKYQVLSKEFNLSAVQVYKLGEASKAVATEQERVAVAAQNSSTAIMSLAQATGMNFAQAQQFAQNLGLTATKATEAIVALQQLKAAKATTEQQTAFLRKEMGLTVDQIQKLSVVASQAKGEMSVFGNAIQGLFQGIGQQVASQALSAVQNSITGTVKSFIAFEDAIKQVGVISGTIGTPELATLKTEVERLGVATSKSPQEIANMTVSLARAGFTAIEAQAALEGIVRASEATGTSLEATGDIIAKTLRGYSLGAEESLRVADALVTTANNTNTSIEGLGESLKYLVPAAAAANQPLEDMLALIGLLGDAGIQGSQAGTNLAAALDGLKLASAGANSEFSDLVKGSAKKVEAFNLINSEVRNADGSMKSLLEVLPVLQDNLNSLGQTDQDLILKSLFGVEGGRAIQVLLNTTADRLDLVTDKIRNAGGVAVEAGEDMLQGLGGSLTLLEGSIGALQVKIGESFAPALEAITREFTEAVNALIASEGLEAFLTLLGNSLKFVAENAEILETILTALAIKMAAMQAIALYTTLAKSALGMEVLAVATGKASISLKLVQGHLLATGAAAATALAPMLALILAIEGIKFAKFALDMASSTESLEEFRKQIEGSTGDAVNAAARTKKAVEDLTAARQAGRQASEEDLEAAKRLIEANKFRLQGLQDELKLAESLPAVTEEQKNARAALTAQLQTSIGVLERQTNALKEATGATNEYTESTKASIDATEQAIDAFDGLTRAIEQSYKERQIAIAEGIAAGNLTEEQGRQASLEAERRYYQERLDLNRTKLEELRLQQQAVSDLEQAKKLQEEILGIEDALLSDRLSLAKSYADERIATEQEAVKAAVEAEQEAAKAAEEAAQKRIAAVEAANRQAQAAIEQSQSDRITAVREAQLAGVIGEEEASAQIVAIQQEQTGRVIAQRQREIESIRGLRAEGLMSAEEAAEREMKLSGEIGQLNLKRIEDEIAAQKRLKDETIKAIEEQAKAQQSKLQGASNRLGLQADSLKGELNLLNAQSNLQSTLADLENERLNTRIKMAEASGNEAELTRLQAQQQSLQSQQMEKQFEAQQQQLKIQQEIRKIELEREQINTRIALLEAQVALSKAQAEGASAQELSALRDILNLRKDQVEAVQDAIDRQNELNKLEQEQLNAQQDIGRERQKQSGIQRQSEGQPQGRLGQSSKPSYNPVTHYMGNDGLVRSRRINAAGSAFSSSLRGGGVSGDSPLRQDPASETQSPTQAIEKGNQAVVEKLEQLNTSILQLANSPRQLTVSTPDPVKDMGRILSEVSGQRLKGAKV